VLPAINLFREQDTPNPTPITSTRALIALLHLYNLGGLANGLFFITCVLWLDPGSAAGQTQVVREELSDPFLKKRIHPPFTQSFPSIRNLHFSQFIFLPPNALLKLGSLAHLFRCTNSLCFALPAPCFAASLLLVRCRARPSLRNTAASPLPPD